MRHYGIARFMGVIVVGLLLTIGLFAVGSIGCTPDPVLLGKHESTEQLSAPLSPTGSINVKNRNGSISVRGEDIQECKVTARICVRTVSDEIAQKLAEEVKVRLEGSSDTLRVRIDKPPIPRGHRINVDLDLAVPKGSSLEITTRNGGVKIIDLSGDAKCETHNGSVTARRISGSLVGSSHNGSITVEDSSGDLKLKTHNGAITTREISGNLRAETHNGRVKAIYAETAPSRDVTITAHNGGIQFCPPKDFSASVNVKANNGIIRTELPVKVVGKIARGRLNGTIGTGEGRLKLETHNGSIKIKNPATDE